MSMSMPRDWFPWTQILSFIPNAAYFVSRIIDFIFIPFNIHSSTFLFAWVILIHDSVESPESRTVKSLQGNKRGRSLYLLSFTSSVSVPCARLRNDNIVIPMFASPRDTVLMMPLFRCQCSAPHGKGWVVLQVWYHSLHSCIITGNDWIRVDKVPPRMYLNFSSRCPPDFLRTCRQSSCSMWRLLSLLCNIVRSPLCKVPAQDNVSCDLAAVQCILKSTRISKTCSAWVKTHVECKPGDCYWCWGLYASAPWTGPCDSISTYVQTSSLWL